MQAVLDKYNLIYKVQAEQVRKSEDDYEQLCSGNVRETTSALIAGLNNGRGSQMTNLTEEGDRTQWLYF